MPPRVRIGNIAPNALVRDRLRDHVEAEPWLLEKSNWFARNTFSSNEPMLQLVRKLGECNCKTRVANISPANGEGQASGTLIIVCNSSKSSKCSIKEAQKVQPESIEWVQKWYPGGGALMLWWH